MSTGEVRTCSSLDLVTDSKAYLVSSRSVRNLVSNADATHTHVYRHVHLCTHDKAQHACKESMVGRLVAHAVRLDLAS